MKMNKFMIPQNFEAKEHTLSHKIELMDEEEKTFGYIKVDKSKGNVSFSLLDAQKNEVAYANKKEFNYGSLIEVFDLFGGLMGTIEHTVTNPMSEPIEKYVIFDAYGKPICESKQQDDISKFVTLFGIDGGRVLSMRKGLNKIKDKWKVTFGEEIDKRVAIFMPVFVSSDLGKSLV